MRSSRSEHSIAWDSTPRIVAGANTVPVAGMVTPGSAMIALMPVRAFGAPHTTCFVPSFVSTTHWRSLSALGCFSASVTWATVKSASSLVLSVTSSTSRPTPIRPSQISSRVALVSRYSLSQESVNFMTGLQQALAPAVP